MEPQQDGSVLPEQTGRKMVVKKRTLKCFKRPTAEKGTKYDTGSSNRQPCCILKKALFIMSLCSRNKAGTCSNFGTADTTRIAEHMMLGTKKTFIFKNITQVKKWMNKVSKSHYCFCTIRVCREDTKGNAKALLLSISNFQWNELIMKHSFHFL